MFICARQTKRGNLSSLLLSEHSHALILLVLADLNYSDSHELVDWMGIHRPCFGDTKLPVYSKTVNTHMPSMKDESILLLLDEDCSPTDVRCYGFVLPR